MTTNKRIRKKWFKKAKVGNFFVYNPDRLIWQETPDAVLRIYALEYQHPRAKKERTQELL